MTVLVASTVAPYKCRAGAEMEALAWLKHADAWKERGHEFFCAVEQLPSDEGIAWSLNMMPLVEALSDASATTWRFMIDDNETELTSGGRLVRICTGRNLAHEAFNRHPGRWEAVLFLDTDTEPPEDAPERLLEVDRQVVGFHVPTYCLDGPRVYQERDSFAKTWRARVEQRPVQDLRRTFDRGERWFPEGADVREHWNTAGALLVRDEAARHLRWRYDLSRGQTDDPCFQEDAVARGYGQTWVRHDVVGRHHPDVIQPLENRGHDLRL